MTSTMIARVVANLARELQGSLGPCEYIVEPLDFFTELERRRPDIVRHVRRYYKCDPYQQIKVWIPRAR